MSNSCFDNYDLTIGDEVNEQFRPLVQFKVSKAIYDYVKGNPKGTSGTGFAWLTIRDVINVSFDYGSQNTRRENGSIQVNLAQPSMSYSHEKLPSQEALRLYKAVQNCDVEWRMLYPKNAATCTEPEAGVIACCDATYKGEFRIVAGCGAKVQQGQGGNNAAITVPTKTIMADFDLPENGQPYLYPEYLAYTNCPPSTFLCGGKFDARAILFLHNSLYQTQDGDTLSVWKDAKTGNILASQSVTGAQPTYRATAPYSDVNGISPSTVEFDATQYMTVLNANLPIGRKVVAIPYYRATSGIVAAFKGADSQSSAVIDGANVTVTDSTGTTVVFTANPAPLKGVLLVQESIAGVISVHVYNPADGSLTTLTGASALNGGLDLNSFEIGRAYDGSAVAYNADTFIPSFGVSTEAFTSAELATLAQDFATNAGF